jgi:hypothetical protein
MALPTQSIVPGQLQDTFERELQGFLRKRIVERLWAKDVSLWPEELVSGDRALADLTWLRLSQVLGPLLESVRRGEQSADADGLPDTALLTFESANLCARALLGFSGIALARKFVVLDSTSPDVIQESEERLDLSRTLFVLANKKSYGLKAHCLFLYFQDKLQAIEARRASRHFVSETEPQTFLATVSRGHMFRDILPDPLAIPPEYCSLLHFGAIFTAVGVAGPEQVLAAANEMCLACTLSDPPAANPALQLAAFLTSAAESHRSYLAFLASPSLMAYRRRLVQLIGGSMAREGPGLIPLMLDVPRDTQAFENETAFVLLTCSGDNDAELAEIRSRFQSSGIPFLHIEIAQPFDLLPETFKWEIATILACARLGFDPFDVSDNRLPRAFTAEILEQFSQGHNPLQRSPRLTERLIQLYADGMTRQEISTMNLVEALQSFLRVSTPGRHVSLLVNMTPTSEVNAAFSAIGRKLTETMKRPVLTAYGPHAAEHCVYFFRESLPYGPCILFTTDPLVDRAIPGARYTFAELYLALSLGEYDTLVHWEHPVIRLHLTHEFPAALQQLVHVFEQSLHWFHP